MLKFQCIFPPAADAQCPTIAVQRAFAAGENSLLSMLNIWNGTLGLLLTSMRKLKYIALLLCLHIGHTAWAQLDTIHWMPPLHARGEDGPQYLYLSTPEQQPFQVTVRDGGGNLITTATISNTQPFVFSLGNNSFTKTLIQESALHKPLSDYGLVMDGPKPFYAYFRAHSTSQFQAGDLTCKGRAALGTTFRIGHLLQGFHGPAKRCNFFSVMATEDSTVVLVTEYEAGTRFRVGGLDTDIPGQVTTLLNKGQSVVYAQYSAQTLQEQAVNGFMGSLVTTSKPCMVNSGSWTGAPVNFSANDVGIDQIVPVEMVGDEYILCRGNGSEILERPIIVAHYNDTKVFINGSATPSSTLQAGDWVALQTSLYSTGGNMYIRTSEPVYVYQMVGGIASTDDQYRTAGLIFVPPVSCGIPNAVDNIFLPNQIGSMDFDGGMMIVAMRDSAVVLTVDGQQVSPGAPQDVAGNPDFVTYRPLTLFSQNNQAEWVSVRAQGAVQVALFGRNQPASFAGFFSGFTVIEKPSLDLTLVGDGVCPDTLIASGNFDGVQWSYADSIIQYGTDSVLIAYAPGVYSALGYLGVCRRTSNALDSIEAVFNSPVFPYSFTEPECFGFQTGLISFGAPSGGLAPYSYSVDQGKTFGTESEVTGLGAGTYQLVVRDSTGCYNRPLEVTLSQPDSFLVRLFATSLPEQLFPGQEARFRATPDRPIFASTWEPMDSSICSDCLTYNWVATDVSTWIQVTVFDSAGCPATDRLFVEVSPNIYAPNAFYPFSVQGTEVFTLFSKDALPITRMRIYDRWGSLVFEQTDFETNDLSRGWSGQAANGQILNPGVFVWEAEVERTTGQIAYLKGEVSLIR
jgi:hypothetical protein